MRALCLVSGGLDSAIALWWAKSRKHELVTLSFRYAGRPAAELSAARDLSAAAGAREHLEPLLPLGPAVLPPRRRGLAPEGYLPQRNLVFYSVAAALAEEARAEALVGGHLRSDGRDFPDARRAFFRRLQGVLDAAAPGRLGPKILLPLARMSKEEAILLGMRLGCPMELSWSCYRDGSFPCGVCSACGERIKSFAVLGFSESRRGTYARTSPRRRPYARTSPDGRR